MRFKLESKYKPAGDQPKAIDALVKGIERGDRYQTLFGVTGSGKTYTMANVIERVQKPTLVIAHNKTLAAQLCHEFREFFPHNAVEYFVSYYDYYQPEAYLPRSDTYIEKEAQINDEIDRLRHASTQALLTRRDTIIVASVSCIYGLGAPQEYERVILHLEVSGAHTRAEILHRLIELQFNRTNADLKRGDYRARGGVIEIMPMNDEKLFRLIMDGDNLREIFVLDPVTRRVLSSEKEAWIFPAKHFVISKARLNSALKNIRAELGARLKELKKEDKPLEYERLDRRTRYDLELIEQLGYCSGIENYSRHFDGRAQGDPPSTLLNYFPHLRKGSGGQAPDFLTIIDESHVTIPQIRGMHEGDRSRKDMLINHGFRLPSARDNRPLKFDEFEKLIGQVVFTSATPSKFEFENSGQIVEQIIRPTGLVDPDIEVRPVSENKDYPGQVYDLINEIKKRVKKRERVLVTTLTKKMAEDLSEFLEEAKVKSKYLHSGVLTLDRVVTLSDFRSGKFDVIVGVNLLREGLDLPEVTLVAILDADKEGFLRSDTSLIQTIGRAARNVFGKVILYADEITGSMKRAMDETERRRTTQIVFNKKYNITPKTIEKKIHDIRATLGIEIEPTAGEALKIELAAEPHKIEKIIAEKQKEMKKAAHDLQFELAALLRDEIRLLNKKVAVSGGHTKGSKKR